MKNNQGFSLLEIIISLFSVAIITSIVALISINQQKMHSKVQLKMQASNEFSRVVRELSSPDIVGKLLGFKEVNSDGNWVEKTPPSPLQKCFSGKGVNCDTLSVNSWVVFTTPTVNYNKNYSLKSGSNCGTSDNPCSYGIIVNYKMNCEENTCHTVNFQISQKYFDVSIADKSVEIQHAGYAFLNKQEIDFSCANSGAISSIDFEKKTAICSSAMGGSFTLNTHQSSEEYYPPSGQTCPGMPPCKLSVFSEISGAALGSAGLTKGSELTP